MNQEGTNSTFVINFIKKNIIILQFGDKEQEVLDNST